MISTYIGCFTLGILFGVIGEWKRRVAYFLWILCVLLTFINSSQGSYDYSVLGWHWIGILITMFGGMWIGQISYQKEFGENKK